jgi:amidase
MTAVAEPTTLSTRELARLLRDGQLSAVEALEAHLNRIDKRNPALNAVVSLDAENARSRARTADQALRRGEIWGPLHGVPMTLKDGHDVAGLRTTVGTFEWDRVATDDGTVAARLRAAGAVIMGHTNVAPWLADHQTMNPVFGRTTNPWATARTPGGSSGGAAAAVAAGLTPLEIGSDLAGSIRLPAHFCGVYGLKPTEHRVPLTGFFRPPFQAPRPVRIMSTLGPLARDLDDLELALTIIAGPDGHDGDVPPVLLGERRATPLRELRLAVAASLAGLPVAPTVRAVVERVATQVSDAGARIEERLPGLDWEALHALFGDLVTTITSVFDPTAALPEEHRTLAWYLDALDRRDEFSAVWTAYYSDIDALILPPAITAAFTHREPGTPIEVDGASVPYQALGGFLVFANLVGLPALVAPAGMTDDGLPIGIQIVGPRWSELRLLDIAQALEAAGALPGFRPPQD